MHKFILFLMSALCTSCGTKELLNSNASVDRGIVIPIGAERYQVKDNQVFLAASTVGEPSMPIYPESLMGMLLPDQRVCVELTISTDGEVIEIKTVSDVIGCPSVMPRMEFVQAVLDQVATWQFFSAEICTFPEGGKKNEDCSGEGVSKKLVPIRLIYYFDFSFKKRRAMAGLKK